MLEIKCSVCHEQLDEPGALYFTPPFDELGEDVTKLHLCRVCSGEVEDFMYGMWSAATEARDN